MLRSLLRSYRLDASVVIAGHRVAAAHLGEKEQVLLDFVLVELNLSLVITSFFSLCASGWQCPPPVPIHFFPAHPCHSKNTHSGSGKRSTVLLQSPSRCITVFLFFLKTECSYPPDESNLGHEYLQSYFLSNHGMGLGNLNRELSFGDQLKLPLHSGGPVQHPPYQ